jgi:hypothetical protein
MIPYIKQIAFRLNMRSVHSGKKTHKHKYAGRLSKSSYLIICSISSWILRTGVFKIGHMILGEHVSAIDRLIVSSFLSLDLSLSLNLFKCRFKNNARP